MTSAKLRLPAAEVRPLAEMVAGWFLCGHLHLGCNIRCEIAGSLRRGQSEVGDVEIVIEPLYDTDLFGTPLPTSAALDAAVERCLRAGLLAWDTDTPRNGPRYKRLRLPELGLPLDLFLTREETWGNLLAIRTGDSEFSRLLVTQRYKGGLLPNWMRHGDGRLLARAKGYPDYKEDPEINEYTENVVPCPTEAAFFRHLCLDVPPMHQRTREGARQLAVEAVRNQQAFFQQSVSQKFQAQKVQVA